MVGLMFSHPFIQATKKKRCRHRPTVATKTRKTITFQRHLTDNRVYYCEVKSRHEYIDNDQSLEPFKCKQSTCRPHSEWNGSSRNEMSRKKHVTRTKRFDKYSYENT